MADGNASSDNDFPAPAYDVNNEENETEAGSDTQDSQDSVDGENSEDSKDSVDSVDSVDSRDSDLIGGADCEDDSIDFHMVCKLYGVTNNGRRKIPQRTCPFTGEQWVQFLLNGHPDTMVDILRMDAYTFNTLCHELLNTNSFKVKQNRLSIQESLAIFLFICGQVGKHRHAADRFQHSTETINRHFRIMMQALCRFGMLVIQPPNPNHVPPEIQHNPKYYPWFQHCIGAIDGTHIAACAQASKCSAYRGRKAGPTQNILAACSFDMKFTFVYPGWKGSASDSRVLSDALTRPDVAFPLPPSGKFYVVDAGFTNMEGFLAPYCSERYHLGQFHGSCQAPKGMKELFNYRHASLRNVIERCFGMLKARFPLLTAMPYFMEVRQGSIVTACCACHNWIRMQAEQDRWFNAEASAMAGQSSQALHPAGNMEFSSAYATDMGVFRDSIATAMWNSYRGRR